MKQSAVASLLFLLFLVLVACGDANPLDRSHATGQVRGQVVEVVARNIVEVETLRIRDDDGVVWTFTSEGFAGFTPSHLREHQLFGQPVLLFYVEKGDSLVAVDMAD
jgi:hypothetical protein